MAHFQLTVRNYGEQLRMRLTLRRRTPPRNEIQGQGRTISRWDYGDAPRSILKLPVPGGGAYGAITKEKSRTGERK